jgi:hypothetical protein
MTYEQFAEMALALPDVSERIGKTEADLSRSGRHMSRLREKGRAVAMRLPWERCEELLESQPEVFFVTPHYQGYPYVLAWLDKLEAGLAEELIRAAWEAAPGSIPLRKTPRL